jgi:hypothetical protein
MKITINRILRRLLPAFFLLPLTVFGQSLEKQVFSTANAGDYYLAVKPQGPVRGVLVLFNVFQPAEAMPPETKLHNVAYANGLLTVYASLQRSLSADSSTVSRVNAILKDAAAMALPGTSSCAIPN